MSFYPYLPWPAFSSVIISLTISHDNRFCIGCPHSPPPAVSVHPVPHGLLLCFSNQTSSPSHIVYYFPHCLLSGSPPSAIPHATCTCPAPTCSSSHTDLSAFTLALSVLLFPIIAATPIPCPHLLGGWDLHVNFCPCPAPLAAFFFLCINLVFYNFPVSCLPHT